MVPYAISLTSIPPRFDRLWPVLDALLKQRPAPSEVFLSVPKQYERFPGAFDLPALPKCVSILESNTDHGPGSKAIVAAQHLKGRFDTLIYCDDDWLMAPGWAAHLLKSQQNGEAVTGQGFDVDRLCRVSPSADGFCDIAQGFAGVLVDPDWLADAQPPSDPVARSVDDIWLSAHLAAKGIGIREAPLARSAITPAYDDAYGLQDQVTEGHNRAAANQRCATLMATRYGIWPEAGSKTAQAARV
ncbi:hypothetical protein [Roseovarius sp. 2305UL8-3]|uniref:hypothetical protein n=1 Tax=Roseovarius conchicola TaxID=3121636 RepID=UPI0035273F40